MPLEYVGSGTRCRGWTRLHVCSDALKILREENCGRKALKGRGDNVEGHTPYPSVKGGEDHTSLWFTDQLGEGKGSKEKGKWCLAELDGFQGEGSRGNNSCWGET